MRVAATKQAGEKTSQAVCLLTAIALYSGTGGHGLGLWVTDQTIDQLGGSIEVLPRHPGRSPPGTLMEVRLPYPREGLAAAEVAATGQAAAPRDASAPASPPAGVLP